MRKLALAASLPLALALGYAVATIGSADAAPAKNLTIYPKGTDTKVLKDDMKKMSKALGVQCDFCHDMTAMEKDTEHKTKARAMLKMTATINAELKKASFKKAVSCNTCHQGTKAPKE
jgi:hypothetical protein